MDIGGRKCMVVDCIFGLEEFLEWIVGVYNYERRGKLVLLFCKSR